MNEHGPTCKCGEIRYASVQKAAIAITYVIGDFITSDATAVAVSEAVKDLDLNSSELRAAFVVAANLISQRLTSDLERDYGIVIRSGIIDAPPGAN